MWINLMETVRIKTEEADSPLNNLLRQEYAPYVSETMSHSRPDIIVSLNEEQKPPNFYRVKAPVSFDDDGVFLFDGRLRVCRVDWARAGQTNVHIRCDPAFNPHFFAIIVEYLVHLKFVSEGSFFCHASAFEWKGRVVLCPAWRNVGKTNLLLSFLEKGARYIADDWALMDASGRIRSLPKRLNLFHYNFEQHPALADKLKAELRNLVTFTTHAVDGHYDLDRRTVDLLRTSLRVRVRSDELTDRPPLLEASNVDFVFMLRRSVMDKVPTRILPIGHDKFLPIIEETLHYEQHIFRLAYQIYKAKTGSTNDLLERYEEKLRELMHSCFSDVNRLYQIHTLGQHQARDVEQLIIEVLDRDHEAASGY